MRFNKDASYEHVSSNLRRLRDQRGWSQRALAGLAGVSRPTIAHLEIGTRVGGTSWRTFDRLCRALGVPMNELFNPSHHANDVTSEQPPK